MTFQNQAAAVSLFCSKTSPGVCQPPEGHRLVSPALQPLFSCLDSAQLCWTLALVSLLCLPLLMCPFCCSTTHPWRPSSDTSFCRRLSVLLLGPGEGELFLPSLSCMRHLCGRAHDKAGREHSLAGPAKAWTVLGRLARGGPALSPEGSPMLRYRG